MKDILLAVMGTSPQVLTETLYALYVQGKPFPDEVYLITSENAKNKVIQSLLEGQQLNKLKEHYQLPEFKFNESHIIVMQNADGNNIFSGRKESDQQDIADSITRLVGKFARDPNCRIHASIAGGRKTMAFYLGYAMSLFGREQDTLSHVFVSEQFEFNEQFYFPTLNNNFITKNEVVLNTKDAEVVLAEIPFVRMRNMVDGSLIDQIEGTSFSKTVAQLNSYKKDGVKLQLNCKAKTISINGIEIKLPPKEFAFYLWISMQSDRTIIAGRDFYEDKSFSASFLKVYARIANDSRMFTSFNVEQEQVDNLSEVELAALSELNPLSKELVQQARTKINKQVKNQLDIEGAKAIQIYSEDQPHLHQVRYYLSSDVVIEHDFDEEMKCFNPKPNRIDQVLAKSTKKLI